MDNLPWLDQIPLPLRSELPRSALLERLRQTQDYRLVVLAAPSGFGKTTLLAQYARQSQRPTLWHTLSADERKLPKLLNTLLTTLTGDDLPRSFPRKSTLEDLIQPLAQQINQRFQLFDLVLDGVQGFDEEAGEGLARLCQQLQPERRILLACHNAKPLRITRLLAQELALLIDEGALAFSLEEAQAYLQGRAFAGDIEAKHREVEGWPAGLALMAAEGQAHLSPLDLVREQLHDLPPQLRRPLARLCVWSEWSTPLPDWLETNLPADWLDQVRGSGLPITLLEHGGVRLHRLLLTALEQELWADRDSAKPLYQRAAEQAQRQGQLLSALRLFRLAGDLTQTFALAKVIAKQYFQQGQPQLLLAICQELLEYGLDDDLTGLYASALLHLGHRAAAEAQLEGRRAQNIYLYYARVLLYGQQMKLEQALKTIDEAFKLSFADDFTLKRSLTRLKIRYLKWTHRLDEAWLLALEEIDLCDPSGGADLAQAYSKAAEVKIYSYELKEARSYALKAAELANQRYDWGHPEIFPIIGTCEYLLGHLDEAATWMKRSLEVNLFQEDFNKFSSVIYLGMIYAAQQKYKDALRLLNESKEAYVRLQMFPVVKLVQIFIAQVKVFIGHYLEAEELLGRLHIIDLDQMSLTLSDPYHFAHGLLYFFKGDLVSAREEFLKISQYFDHGLRVKLYLAEIARRSGELQPSHIQAVRAYMEWSGATIFPADRRHLAALFEHELWLAPAPAQALPTSTPPVPLLHLQTLGSFRLWFGEQEVRLSLTKSAELLTFLAVHGPSRREEIIEALWDGSSEPRHVDYFKVALRRLRQDLQAQVETALPVVEYTASHHYLLTLPCELDVLKLNERAYAQSDQLLSLSSDFMPQMGGEWAEELRERTRAGLVAQLLSLAETCQAYDQQTAQTAYSRALDIEPLASDVLITQLRALVQDQRQAEAQWVLSQRRAQLSKHFGLDVEDRVLRAAQDFGLSAPPALRPL